MKSLFLSGFVAIILWVYPCTLQAQVKDSVYLPELIILEDAFEKVEFQLGADIKKVKLGSSVSNQSLADILQTLSPLFFRNQGAGLVATVSQNGFAPHQTKVEWNGMEINHPMVGLVDFSIISSNFISEAEFSSTYSQANPGSMALGGVIHLKTNNENTSRSSLQYEQAQFGKYGFQFDVSSKQNSFVKLAYSQAQNDFEYYNPVFGTREKRKRNANQSIGFQAGKRFSVANKELNSTLWLQHIFREIPGAVGTTASDATQQDGWIRLSNELVLENGEKPWKFYANFSVDKLDYRDTLLASAGSDELSKSLSYKSQIRTTKRLLFSRTVWSDFNLERLDNWVNTNNYDELKFRGITRFISHSTITVTKSIFLYPIIQLEHFSDFGWALSPSLGTSWEWKKNRFQWFGSISRAYTAPSLNALYWPTLGDPNLKPEEAIKLEFGYRFKWENKTLSVKQSSSYLLADIKNGIQWIPVQSQWRPQNILALKQQAFTANVELKYAVQSWYISLVSTINMAESIIQKSRFEGDESVGNTLMYIPDIQFKQWFQFGIRNVQLDVNYQRVGNRFINLSNSDWLDPYQQVDVRISGKKRFRRMQLECGLYVNNITDERYSVIKGYPVPGRITGIIIKTTLN
ncbi:TonB-dependent receptor [bacterium]|nr:MAG: TonB-dependent receptor [bacterium]